ncbi:hypothetical protein V6N13_137739 [Hibiscus sabdariffa]|uniref:Uncharacterized protein n=1 Tax=Hibiscus sabdariffa TaxID=183260 RepID=A0ABR2DJR3_9ROSI
MNRFQLCLFSLVVLLFLFTSGIPTSGVSAEHSRQPRQHGFRPRSSSSTSSPFKGQPNTQLGEEKRRVPTGSNPLHNSLELVWLWSDNWKDMQFSLSSCD